MRDLEDDDECDPNLLRDGEVMHVPMKFCDAMPRDLAAARARGTSSFTRDSESRVNNSPLHASGEPPAVRSAARSSASRPASSSSSASPFSSWSRPCR
jgi:hypothetical protein